MKAFENNIVERSSERIVSFRNIMEPLLVVFNCVSAKILPDKKYYMAFSVPGGIYGYFDDYEIKQDEIDRLLKEIKSILNENIDIDSTLGDKSEVLKEYIDKSRHDILELINEMPETNSTQFRLADIKGHKELFINDIQLHLGKLKEINLIKFRKGFILIADNDFFTRTMPTDLNSSKYVWRFDELEANMQYHQVSDISSLNKIIKSDQLSDFIKISEAFHEKKIMSIADRIAKADKPSKLIFIAGPTSSGKTTFAYRLGIGLKVNKKKVLKLSLDDYYLDHALIPIDEQTGMQNFEVIDALDLKLFKENIIKLLNYEPVHLPKYNFNKGGHCFEETPTLIDENTFIIVEGIHGLNPQLWQNIDSVESFRIYISALNTLNVHDHLPISTSDHRLIRRLVRDYLFRGYDINETLMRWPDVMHSEYLNIFPFQESAHVVFNSALVYELAVFAYYAQDILKVELAKNEYTKNQIERLLRLLSLFVPINPSDIPPTSILREFVGGSSFKY